MGVNDGCGLVKRLTGCFNIAVTCSYNVRDIIAFKDVLKPLCIWPTTFVYLTDSKRKRDLTRLYC